MPISDSTSYQLGPVFVRVLRDMAKAWMRNQQKLGRNVINPLEPIGGTGLCWVAKVAIDSTNGIYVGYPVEQQLEIEPGGGWTEEPVEPDEPPDPSTARVLWRIVPDSTEDNKRYFEFAGQSMINGQYPDVLPSIPETMYEESDAYHPQYIPNLGLAPNGWCPVVIGQIGQKAFVVYSPFGGVLGGPSNFPELPIDG